MRKLFKFLSVVLLIIIFLLIKNYDFSSKVIINNFPRFLNNDVTGYSQSVFIGRNNSSYQETSLLITDQSLLTFNFNYSNEEEESSNYTHNLTSSVLLPIGTMITLIDQIKNNVYQYQVDSSLLNPLYPFTLFKEVGRGTNLYFIEDSYYNEGMVKEKFIIILDFSSATINKNYLNMSIGLELHDSNSNVVRETLETTIKEFSIYNETQSSLSLTTSFLEPILFNSDSTYMINLTSKLNYPVINGKKIIDTTKENMEIGLLIKVVDASNKIIESEKLKSLSFKIGNKEYYFGSDHLLRLNLEEGLADTFKTLTIKTTKNNSDLEKGEYYLKINNYLSLDGNYYEELGDEISIPLVVSFNKNLDSYNFAVLLDDADRFLIKEEERKVIFDILLNGPFINPKLFISLYEKEEDDYKLVSLEDYISDILVKEDDRYLITDQPSFYEEPDYLYNYLELNLILEHFNNTGYKFVISLYDGEEEIESLEKYFIIREEE
ncbi:MAG: hypothetical protein ACOXZR_02255 [Bacilli bacterium]